MNSPASWPPAEPQPVPAPPPGRPRVPWTVGDVARGVLVPLLLYGVLFVARRVLGEAPTPTAPATGARLLTGLLVILFQLTLLIPALWALRKYRVGPDVLGLRGFAVLPGCGLVIALLIMGYLFTGAWGLFLQQYGLRAQPSPLPVFGSGIAGLALALLAGGIVAPVTEEIFFRGFLYPALRNRLGVFWGIAFAAAIFAAAHLQPLALPALFALGVLLTVLYQSTGSLWPGILMHSTINTVALVALYIIGDNRPV